MGIKMKIAYKWRKMRRRIDSYVAKLIADTNKPAHVPMHPLTMEEWFAADYDTRLRHKRSYYRAKLEALKEDVNRTVLWYNGKLTYSQIMELEDIKRNLKLLK